MATKGALALNTVVDDILDNAYPALDSITSLEYLAVGGGGGGGAANGGGGGAGGFSAGTIPVTVAPFSYSAYFNGSTDYLTVPSNAALAFGTGQFTIEGWFYWTGTPSGTIVGTPVNGGLQWYAASGTLGLNIYNSGNVTAATLPSLNAWHHIAMTRDSSNVCTIWIDGINSGSASSTASFPQSTWYIYGGGSGGLAGYVSNFRVLKGTALYTANFTPPKQSLTAITNTSLLTLNTTFDDSSTNNFVITKVGLPKISSRSPFENPVIVNVGLGGVGSSAAATLGGNGGNTIVNSGWSGYFNNSTSDVIKVDSNATGFAIGTGNFTVEGWFNSVDYSHWQHLFHLGGSGHYGIVLYRSTSNNIVVQVEGSTIITYDFTPILGAWYHFALVRTGTGSNQTTLYINGRSVATGTSSGNISADNIFVGGLNWGTGNNWSGYISNIRLLKGFALYTSNFIPPTSSLTAIPNTVLLTLQNSAFIDNSSFLNVVNKLGSASTTNLTSPFEIKMLGGGGGASYSTAIAPNGWASGGGDAGSSNAPNRGSSGIYGQGTPGGTRNNVGIYGSGGGGGAGQVGGIGGATSVGNGGKGGDGLYSNITGSNVAYAGGGGGNIYNSYPGSGLGGTGGGGAANSFGGFPGVIYSGSGGGGAGFGDFASSIGGSGGTGVVILRHPIAYDIIGRSANAIGVSYSSGYKIYTLRATDTVYFTARPTVATPNVASVSCLIVAGGGSGGATIGGGGGGGGVLTVEDYLIMRGNTVTVTVGAGGLGDLGSYPPAPGPSGTNSVFGDSIAIGGGGGACWPNTGGADGGSGGGAGGGDGNQRGGNGTAGQGSRGGTSDYYVGGGGGGAGEHGLNSCSVTRQKGGNGGRGLLNDITGTPTYYAGGGASGVDNGQSPSGAPIGGLGGGGSAFLTSRGGSGEANSGGGGAAGCNAGGSSNFGGSGGSGVVIISYATKYGLATSTTGSPTITTVNSNYVYKWTTSGSITY